MFVSCSAQAVLYLHSPVTRMLAHSLYEHTLSKQISLLNSVDQDLSHPLHDIQQPYEISLVVGTQEPHLFFFNWLGVELLSASIRDRGGGVTAFMHLAWGQPMATDICTCCLLQDARYILHLQKGAF